MLGNNVITRTNCLLITFGLTIANISQQIDTPAASMGATLPALAFLILSFTVTVR